MRLALPFALLVPAAALSQIPGDDPAAIGRAVPARVRTASHASFFDCPRASCRARPYLVAGDPVIVWKHDGGYTLVSFADGRGGGHDGWLADGALVAASPDPPRLDWIGHWRGPERDIEIRRGKAPGHLLATGDATWGARDPDRVARGGVNIGTVAADLIPSGNAVAFSQGTPEEGGRIVTDENGDRVSTLSYDAPGDEFRCRIRLRRVGDYLLASDNGNCGGHNVTFSGAYRRAAPASGSRRRAASTSITGTPSRIG
jgi:hypothetical protein